MAQEHFRVTESCLTATMWLDEFILIVILDYLHKHMRGAKDKNRSFLLPICRQYLVKKSPGRWVS